MAEPIEKKVEGSKEWLLENFHGILESAGMRFIGKNRELGLISFRNKNGDIFYGHIIEHENEDETTVNMAPGLSYLGDRDPSKVPTNSIREVYREMDRYTLED